MIFHKEVAILTVHKWITQGQIKWIFIGVMFFSVVMTAAIVTAAFQHFCLTAQERLQQQKLIRINMKAADIFIE